MCVQQERRRLRDSEVGHARLFICLNLAVVSMTGKNANGNYAISKDVSEQHTASDEQLKKTNPGKTRLAAEGRFDVNLSSKNVLLV